MSNGFQEPGRTRIKVCGVRDRETALAALGAGADALGFVFVPSSPRFIEPAAAWAIVRDLPPLHTTVGLTVGASVEEFSRIERECPTDYGQLHGNESVETVRACGPRVFKAIQYDAESIEDDLRLWGGVDEVDAILVDGSAGGEGTSFDWSGLAAAIGATGCAKPIVLAGGLTFANVGDAIAAVRPWAVDVSSGVERERGVKDAGLIAAFCNTVRAADDSINRSTT